ncbi:MAG: GNAT family N-acetyltransferase [Oscillospiraceae bacterium]|nr:GNAT family N-acetyltransferase [Oscillospiraceae bacterium]
MVQQCGTEHLSQCVEIAFKRNNMPESSCAYCPKTKDSINDELAFIIGDTDCLMTGYFVEENLAGMLGCFVNPDNRWADCIGPFFMDEWNQDFAYEMFMFAKETLSETARFNFYFNSKNKDYHQLMKRLSAERGDNEYMLLLAKPDYKPQNIKARVVKYSSGYESDIIQLHDATSPDMYITGNDIISSVNKSREVFCVLDDEDSFAGFGVLKNNGSKDLTAEVFAVKPDKRGKGYGWALLNAVVDSAFNKHNGDTVYLIVDKLNTRARDLYYSCGFKLAVENEAYHIKV